MSALQPQELTRYLARIGFASRPSANLATLRELHAAHLKTIPFENIDVTCGVPVTLDPQAAFTKIVDRKRGGWCFEMNALFAQVLRAIGFEVALLGASVGARERGDASRLDHLALHVQLDEPYLADVGFGTGFLYPLPLHEGTHSDTRSHFRLVPLERGTWRVELEKTGGWSYDFTLKPRVMGDFAPMNAWLQSDPESYFVQRLICCRFTEDAFLELHGTVLQEGSPPGGTICTHLKTRAAFDSMLVDRFGLHPAETPALWQRVRAPA